MCLVEGIFRKAHHTVEDLVCRLLVDPFRSASGHIFFLIAIDKVFSLLCHDGGLLLGHGTAHQVASAK